jgi:hypothetical protein
MINKLKCKKTPKFEQLFFPIKPFKSFSCTKFCNNVYIIHIESIKNIPPEKQYKVSNQSTKISTIIQQQSEKGKINGKDTRNES